MRYFVFQIDPGIPGGLKKNLRLVDAAPENLFLTLPTLLIPIGHEK